MNYYKGVLTVGKKKRQQRERVIYAKGEDIIRVLDIAKKIRFAKWQKIDEIDKETYFRGVSSKDY